MYLQHFVIATYTRILRLSFAVDYWLLKAVSVQILFSIILLCVGCSHENNSAEPRLSKAVASDNCEFFTQGTSEPASSGTPLVISESTGTVISANFFDSGAIDLPYRDGNEIVSVCVSSSGISNNRVAEITSDVGLDDDFRIKAYPQFIVGTKFGNIYETSFRYYSNAGLADDDKWPVTSDKLSNQNTPFEFANLAYISVDKGVGLPAFTNNLPSIYITLDLDEENVVGAERDVMLESWFYDTSANASKIGNNNVTGLPIANTLNNIVGVGHPHFDELDNTLLEMMVHIGALSDNDVSRAKNNPGQNQLTEIFSGNDYDLDGIDDHFDVDSHAYINSLNPGDPKAGLYSSGIDTNGDGIDDADLLPVQIGSHLYSIWYGQSFLSPIVIFSRETNSSLENDFDPDTPDMDLTAEGEIELPWNEFIEFTLNEIQPLLESRGVPWSLGLNNVFDRMAAPSGAIGGVEFGVEPQTNNDADEPYVLAINKFEVLINGKQRGIKTDFDTQPPIVKFSIPVLSGASLASSIVKGSVSDSSGVGRVDYLLRSLEDFGYYDVEGNAIQWSPTSAILSDVGEGNFIWEVPFDLPGGKYRIYSRAIDFAGNVSEWIYTDFVTPLSDLSPPVITVELPEGSDSSFANNVVLSGISNDSGSGTSNVQFMIRDTVNFNYFDELGNSTVWGPRSASIGMSDGVDTEWNITTSLQSGTYRLYVRAIDFAGNVSDWEIRDFRIVEADLDSPSATILVPANRGDIVGDGLLKGIVEDELSGISSAQYLVRRLSDFDYVDLNGDSVPWGPNEIQDISSGNWEIRHNLPPGFYRLYIRALDNAGNVSQWINNDFIVPMSDVTSPVIVFNSPEMNGLTFAGDSVFSGLSRDLEAGTATVQFMLRERANFTYVDVQGNETVWGPISTDLQITGTAEAEWSVATFLPSGLYRLYIRGIDNSGNVSSWYIRDFQISNLE